jgi:hypothetical protein
LELKKLDYVLINNSPIKPSLVKKYKVEKATPIEIDKET